MEVVSGWVPVNESLACPMIRLIDELKAFKEKLSSDILLLNGFSQACTTAIFKPDGSVPLTTVV